MSKKKSVDKEFVLGKMQALCSKTEKCSFDVEQKIKNYPLDEKDRDWILNQLKEDKFIDDQRFAGFFVKDKFRFNKWGRIKIRHAMHMKKIDDQIIDRALEEQLDEAEYLEVLKELLVSKNRSLKDKNMFSRKGKLVRFATQRGFEPELVFERVEGVMG